MSNDHAKAMEMLKAVVDDGCAEINGRSYEFSKVPFKEARKVFAFYSSVQDQLGHSNLWFLESQEFEAVEKIIESRILYSGSALNKIGGHWDKYPEDYVIFITTALGVISYPFLPASDTSSQSQEDQQAPTTSKKPMSQQTI
jgi:hypothetical protein